MTSDRDPVPVPARPDRSGRTRRADRCRCVTRWVVGLFLLGPTFFACELEVDPPHLGDDQRAIIGGDRCDERDHPSAVAIILDAELEMLDRDPPIPAQRIRTVFCTGTLIAPDVVLAAAHCLYPWLRTGVPGTVRDGRYFVSFTADLGALGGLDLDQPLPPLPDDAIEAIDWQDPPSFSTNLLFEITPGLGNLNDVGLLFLERPVTGVVPAALITPVERAQLAVDASVTIVGWGQQTEERRDPLEPPPPGIVGEKVCGATVINEIGTYEMQVGIDAATPRKCHGDSGGPTYLVVDGETEDPERLVGITSHTYDTTDCARGAVDTRVDAWLDWIDGTMTAACDGGVRSWCEVPGILPPDYLPAEPDGGGGCAVAGSREHVSPHPLFVVLLLVWSYRKRWLMG